MDRRTRMNARLLRATVAAVWIACPWTAQAQTATATAAPDAPAAVMNALTDALGVKDLPMPATPEVVWRAAQRTAPKMAAE